MNRIAPCLLALIVGLSVVPAWADNQPAPATPAVTAPLPPAKPDFGQWLQDLRAEALKKGIRDATLNEALNGLQPIDKVLDFDKRQPEFTLTLDQYLSHVLTPEKIAQGKKLLHLHYKLLDKIFLRYHVPPQTIVALWGIESGFGKNIGSYPVVQSLATLAYDGRRSQYFRTELINALTIVDHGATPQQMRGSWAGAMGQCQFMPSTYLKYAQKWEGEGTADIWTDPADIFASAANYLGSVGWDPHQSWGRPVLLPANFDKSQLGLSMKKTVREWAKLGIRRADGKPLPKSDLEASLVTADPGRDATGQGPPFLVYDNFRTYMNWNRSVFFGVAAGTLADRIASR
ncbi:MAG TPA: lytic murein transglycosylase [Magnetospirillaceae bacterium]